MPERRSLYGRWNQLPFTASGTIRLRDYLKDIGSLTAGTPKGDIRVAAR
jgi:hypothetical protein